VRRAGGIPADKYPLPGSGDLFQIKSCDQLFRNYPIGSAGEMPEGPDAANCHIASHPRIAVIQRPFGRPA